MRQLLLTLLLCLSSSAYAASPCEARKHGARVIHLCGDRVEAFHHRPKRNYARAARAPQPIEPAMTPAPRWRVPASPDAARHLMMRRTPGEPIPSPAP